MIKFCPYCGQPINEGEKFCSNCGAEAPRDEINSGTEEEPVERYMSLTEAAFNGQSPASYESNGYQNVTGHQQQYAQSQPEESGNGSANQPKRSKWWIIVVIILALVILGAIMAYLLSSRSTPEQVEEDNLSTIEETPDTSEGDDNKTEQEETEQKEEQEQQEHEVQEETPPQNDEVTFPVEPEFDPDPNYDKYTVVEYNLAGEATAVTVCSNNAETDFEILCNFFGDDQEWRGTWDGSHVKTEYDRTAFIAGDAPGIIQKAIDANNWKTIE